MCTNASLRLALPRNLLVVIAGGLPERPLPVGERFQHMPAFGPLLATWLRGTWGGTATAVALDEVRAVRSMPPLDQPCAPGAIAVVLALLAFAFLAPYGTQKLSDSRVS